MFSFSIYKNSVSFSKVSLKETGSKRNRWCKEMLMNLNALLLMMPKMQCIQRLYFGASHLGYTTTHEHFQLEWPVMTQTGDDRTKEHPQGWLGPSRIIPFLLCCLVLHRNQSIFSCFLSVARGLCFKIKVDPKRSCSSGKGNLSYWTGSYFAVMAEELYYKKPKI